MSKTIAQIMEERKAAEAAAGGALPPAAETNVDQARALAQAGAKLAAQNVGQADNANEADAIAAAALAAGGQPLADLQAAAAEASNQRTGMQSSASPQSLSKMNINSTSTQSAPVSLVDRDTVKAGDFIALNLNQFHLANGKKIVPTNGVYSLEGYPEAEREEIVKQLTHYAGQYGLVEKV